MSAEHKPPLYAFLVVMTVGVLVMVLAARSEAFRDEVLKRTVVVAGAALDRVTGEPPVPAAKVAGSTVPVSSPAEDADRDQRAAHRGPGHAAGQQERGHGHGRATAARSGQEHGGGKAHGVGGGPGNAVGQGVGNGLAQAPGLVTAPGQGGQGGPAQGKATGHGQGKGNSQSHSQGKGSSQGKSQGKGTNG